MKIGNIEINGNLALAPMAGVTDIAFREICREHGAAVTYTEMVSAKALVYQDKKTRTLLEISEFDHPVAAQIFGSDPVCMAQAAVIVMNETKADFIDINMGCPVGKIVKNGEGSALMLNPSLAGKIVEAVVQAVDCPVTVKIRRGFDKGNLNAVEFAQALESAGAAAITVHGRTRVQMYSGTVDYMCIKNVKNSVKIPVFANGDIFSAEEAERVLALTEADGLMLGRGTFGNPWLFSECRAALAGEPIPTRPTVSELAETAQRQLFRACEIKGERSACLDARRHFAWYLKGVPYAGYYKKQIAEIASFDDIARITADIKKNLG